MRFLLDLHVHTRHSRATSKDCDLEHLHAWALRKGLRVVGTGDFTHPAWIAELREKLVPAEPGLYRLRDDLRREVEAGVPRACGGEVRFIPTVEISTIYKKDGATRKVHHLVVAPDLEAAGRLRGRLERVGNISSDGRPILGLDSRHLLEMVLESGAGAYLVPAHIWTPWFSLFGSKSGFDSIEACYGDLSAHIFALETGLSSDPEMNWRVSRLDRCRLVSSSDAHSPAKLGREATVLDTSADQPGILAALRDGTGYVGTLEFFPDEGKYHLDGHRACGVRLSPEESRANGKRCPVCGKELTLGVLNRVEELADRPAGQKPATAGAFTSIVPLEEILAEIAGTGTTSRKVAAHLDAVTSSLGPELAVLCDLPLEELRQPPGGPLLAEAVSRMRRGLVRREGGYDGEYGVIRLFEEGEVSRRGVVVSVGEAMDGAEPAIAAAPGSQAPAVPGSQAPAWEPPGRRSSSFASNNRKQELPQENVPKLELRNEDNANPVPGNEHTIVSSTPPPPLALDPAQRAAVEADGSLLVVAGPGSGKTRVLAMRLARLAREGGEPPERLLAITFTRKAAGEMRERLRLLLPDTGERILATTFHGLGLRILREHRIAAGLPEGFRVADAAELAGRLRAALKLTAAAADKLLRETQRLRAQEGADPSAWPAEARAADAALRDLAAAEGLLGHDDLIRLPLALLARDPAALAAWRGRFAHIAIDEYQDIDAGQYRLMRLLAGPGTAVCAIGDPDQAIYGFRGADVGFFLRFREDHPGATEVRLERNYRSGRAILQGSAQMIAPASLVPGRSASAASRDATPIVVHEAPSARAEAEYVARTIEALVGGVSFFSLDSRRSDGTAAAPLSFGDVAVLFRTADQAGPLEEALGRLGLPFQTHGHRPLAEAPGAADLVRLLGAPGLGRRPDLVQAIHAAAKALAAAGTVLDPDGALLAKLLALAAVHPSLPDFLTALAAEQEADLLDQRAERVSLLTLHAAKGLEFPVVFITGCEDGLLPLRFGDDDPGREAEERRLFFVGMTRAKRRLYLTRAKRRLRRGRLAETAPSPFLAAIAGDLLERSAAKPGRRKAPPPPSLFDLL